MPQNISAYTNGLSSGDGKVVGKEYSMIFAIKNDFVDDFCSLFIFFEYNVGSEICVLQICKKMETHSNINRYKKYSIIDFIFKYDAIKIYSYLCANNFVESIWRNNIIVLIKNCSLLCFEDIIKTYTISKDSSNDILNYLFNNKKLSFDEKKSLIQIISKTNNKKLLYQLTKENKNIVCLAMETEQYELALWLMQKYGCLLLHGSFHIGSLQNKQDKKRKDFYEQIKPYKDELYLCREIMYLILQGHKYDENSTIFRDKFPLDIVKYILRLFYNNRVEEIYHIKDLQHLE